MQLDLTETQSLLEETLFGLLEAEVPFDRIRELERSQGWDAELWQCLAERGFLSLLFAESEDGGVARQRRVEVGLLTEQLARRAAMVPVLEVALGARILAEASAADWVTGVVDGRIRPVPALLEGSDHFETVEASVDPAGRVSGEKVFVDYGQHATHHIVAARHGGELGLYWVDSAGEGVTCRPLKSVGRTPVARVRYASVPAQRLGGESEWRNAIRLGRVLAAVQCTGAMQTALEMTVQYAKVREQFGQKIGSFQAVRHHCANMLSRITSARLMAFEALSLLDEDGADDVRPAAAKAAASRAAPDVLMLAHQIHGGNGVIEENDLYFFTLRGKERSLSWGSSEECLAVMAEHVAEPVDWL